MERNNILTDEQIEREYAIEKADTDFKHSAADLYIAFLKFKIQLGNVRKFKTVNIEHDYHYSTVMQSIKQLI